jgi:hypothetical protein
MKRYPLQFIHIKQGGKKIYYGPKYIVTDTLGSELFIEADFNELYNLVFEALGVSLININCDYVEYHDDHIDLFVSTW